MTQLIAVTPEEYDPNIHTLPVAGELLLAGATAVINDDGVAYTRKEDDNRDAQGYVIEYCKPGDIAEITAQTTEEIEGGIFISKFWVLTVDA